MLGRNNFFSSDIEPSCEYCLFGELSKDKQSILCIKKGVVSPFFSCSKFKYDITKRNPKPALKMKSYDDEDFSI